ncbi:hypothetical protein E2C01_068006 [Portunus trituberculatus]|uniref:Uncharacterized protein n=1 Tax=Portunus trituberculatus TaxID=210409 RepID=A0A5B7HML3_PORTR|nr:hypothetical protein [Portunus trituberculatus]
MGHQYLSWYKRIIHICNNFERSHTVSWKENALS